MSVAIVLGSKSDLPVARAAVTGQTAQLSRSSHRLHNAFFSLKK